MSVMLGYQLFSLLSIAYGECRGRNGRRNEGGEPLNGWMDGRKELMKFIEVTGVPCQCEPRYKTHPANVRSESIYTSIIQNATRCSLLPINSVELYTLVI